MKLEGWKSFLRELKTNEEVSWNNTKGFKSTAQDDDDDDDEIRCQDGVMTLPIKTKVSFFSEGPPLKQSWSQ